MDKSQFFEALDFSSISTPNDKTPLSKIYESKNSPTNCSLAGLSKVNLFIGANNSGKSRFMRALFYHIGHTVKLSGIDLHALENIISESDKKIDLIFNSIKPLTPELKSRISQYIHQLDPIRHFLKNYAFSKQSDFSFLDTAIKTLSLTPTDIGNLALRIFNSDHPAVVLKDPLLNHFSMLRTELIRFRESLPKETSYPKNHIYIPILRGLRCDDKKEYFLEKIFTDYFERQSQSPARKISNGFYIHSDLTSGLLNSSFTRERIMKYEDFLSREFFENKKIQISPKEKETVYIKIGDSEELPIYQLGDGMQTIVMMTFAAFFEENKCLIFAEEPETYLHPGMQRRLIEVILNNEILNQHQWFFTTHSNHFLDLTLDYEKISVFKFSPQQSLNKFSIELMSSPDHSLLREIGVQAASIFRSNAIIWVEGITDRLYLRKALSCYFKQQGRKYKEDIHYSFVELGGSNMVHFDFSDTSSDEAISAKKVVGESFVIIDGDNIVKGERVQNFQIALGDNLYILTQKELENLIPERLVHHSVKSILEKSKRPNKAKEIDLISQILFHEYSRPGIEIGHYIDQKLGIISDSQNKKGYFSTASGTINQKVEFCKLAVNEYTDTDLEASADFKKLIEKVAQFVISKQIENIKK